MISFFTSEPKQTSENVTIIQDYITGDYNNYLKTNYIISSVMSVKQSGQNIPFYLQDIDGDGKLEIMIGNLTGIFSVIYKIQNVSENYQEIIEATIYSDGIQDNYFLTNNFPIMTLNSPSSGIVEGNYKNKVRVGKVSGKIDIDYVYDNGEINTIAKQIKKILDLNNDLRVIIVNQYSSLEENKKIMNIDNKYLSLYNRAYEFQNNFSLENTYYNNETLYVGTWSFASSANTYYYFAGNETEFQSNSDKLLDIYRQEISTYSLYGNYCEKKEESLTITVSPSGNKDFYTIDKAIDGLLGQPYSYQSNDINPVTIYLELPNNKYLTKIRINSTPNEEIQNITNISICDSIGVSGLINPITIFSGSKDISNEFYEFYCQQNFNYADFNGNELVYLPNKKIISITINRPNAESVWLNEVEVFYADYVSEDLNFLNETFSLYNQLLNMQSQTFGPNTGYDTDPAVGRATWYQNRSQDISQRKINNEVFKNIFSNQDIVSQVSAEGDTLYNISQKKNWRIKFEDSKNKYLSVNDSLNNNAISIVQNNQQLIDYERYI